MVRKNPELLASFILLEIELSSHVYGSRLPRHGNIDKCEWRRMANLCLRFARMLLFKVVREREREWIGYKRRLSRQFTRRRTARK